MRKFQKDRTSNKITKISKFVNDPLKHHILVEIETFCRRNNNTQTKKYIRKMQLYEILIKAKKLILFLAMLSRNKILLMLS